MEPSIGKFYIYVSQVIYTIEKLKYILLVQCLKNC
jgi:hypothetical protein